MFTFFKLFIFVSLFAIAGTINAQTPSGVNIVFIGNSITYGATLVNRSDEAPPAVVKRKLEERGVVGEVNIANLGVCGATTVDWLPNNETLFKTAIEAGDAFAKSKSPLIFSISLGTNDSAISGTNGAPLSNDSYANNLCQIIDALLARYPQASIIVNHPIWYSENTFNSAMYLLEGQKRLDDYRTVITDVVNQRYRAKDKGRVYIGDTEAWDIFKDKSQQLLTPEGGQAGIFRLHPNKEGAERLTTLWERRIYDIWRHESPEEITLPDGAKMLLYRSQSATTDKAVVVCPGGGYEFLASDHEGTRFAHWLSNNGTTAAVLLYRMPKGDLNIPQNDARQAIAAMRDNASQWGNYSQVGIMGSSAGGHLASTAATHFTDKHKVDFQILLYPVISMTEELTHKGSQRNLLGETPSEEQIKLFSNELQVTPQTPRAFIFLSANDDLVPAQNALLYATSLIENRVPVAIHAYPTGGHGWGWSDGFFYKNEWTAELLRWLKQF